MGFTSSLIHSMLRNQALISATHIAISYSKDPPISLSSDNIMTSQPLKRFVVKPNKFQEKSDRDLMFYQTLHPL